MRAYFALVFPLSAMFATGCTASDSHPPLLEPAGAEDSVPCVDLRDAGEGLTMQLPGILKLDGQAAGCVVDGTECGLVDIDGGICDGGPDAAKPVAVCEESMWVGRCGEPPKDASTD